MKPYLNAPVNEVRLRIGAPVGIISGDTAYNTAVTVDSDDIQYVIEHAVRSSVHSHREQLCNGYIDYNGLRIGLCGTGIYKEGKLHSIADISSLNIRVPAERKGIFAGFEQYIFPLGNTLIISPPGGGKTTALRELVRTVSERGFRVSVVDERNEIAAKTGAVMGFELGKTTDVMTNLPKVHAIEMLLRSMNPEIIALDELSGQSDIEKIRSAVLNGIVIYATCHGTDTDDAKKKGLDFFERYLVIKKTDGRHVYEFRE